MSISKKSCKQRKNLITKLEFFLLNKQMMIEMILSLDYGLYFIIFLIIQE